MVHALSFDTDGVSSQKLAGGTELLIWGGCLLQARVDILMGMDTVEQCPGRNLMTE